MTPSLSILCVTKGESHAAGFITDMATLAGLLSAELVICVDGERVGALDITGAPRAFIKTVHSSGYLESVLEECLSYCQGDYILRLDDDEKCSPAMVTWLLSGAWAAFPAWSFPRANLWQPGFYIADYPLWPDAQVRLTTADRAGGRGEIHAGSPYAAHPAPVMIEHHKFLVRSYADRRAIAENYERIKAGAGLGPHFKAFGLPEDVFERPHLKPMGEGAI